MDAHVSILRLTVERFRGLESLDWRPSAGMNLILGGGDLGKTTVLEAIDLLFQPSNSAVLSEADYWQRDYETEFVITAVVRVRPEVFGSQSRMIWPWRWDGTNAVQPHSGDEDADASESEGTPVYRVRVRGTPELEAVWEIVQPDGALNALTVATRRRIGIVRLSDGGRHDRDLRLVYGSALDRLLSDQGLRSRIGQQVAGIDLTEKLTEPGQEALEKLDARLEQHSLPKGLELGFTGGPGVSIGSLIGLTASNPQGTPLPYSSWGEGTRRMAALQTAALTLDSVNIATVDEVERGLEPYRLRILIKSLEQQSKQSFLTTHSAVAIGAADEAALWYIDLNQNLKELHKEQVASLQKREPETFLSRLVVLAEGATEAGFVTQLLRVALPGNLEDHGVYVCEAQGNDKALGLLGAFTKAGMVFCGFVDHEGSNPERWLRLRDAMGPRLFQWEAGNTEMNLIPLFDDRQTPELIYHSDPRIMGERLVTLRDRLRITSHDLQDIKHAAAGELNSLIVAAATGSTSGARPEEEKLWKAHSRRWFKSRMGGRELAYKALSQQVLLQLEGELIPFINAVRTAVGFSEHPGIKHGA